MKRLRSEIETTTTYREEADRLPTNKELEGLTDLTYIATPLRKNDHVLEWFTHCVILNTLSVRRLTTEDGTWLTYVSPTLRELSISHGQVPSQFSHLVHLERLAIIRSGITKQGFSFPELDRLTQLHCLAIDGCFLVTVPDTISCLIQLNTLDLSRNRLTVIPEAISSLTALTTLALGDNMLRCLPTALSTLTRLTTLHLAENRLQCVPPVVYTAWTQLKHIDMSHNAITSLPSSFCIDMIALTHLDLNSNDLSSSNGGGDVWHFPSLRALTLRNCQLTASPKISPETISSLQVVDLARNALVSGPAHFMKRFISGHMMNLYLDGNPSTALLPYASLSKGPTQYAQFQWKYAGLIGWSTQFPTRLAHYRFECAEQIMLLRQYIKQKTEEGVFIDEAALLWTIGEYIASLFHFACMSALYCI